MVAAPAPEFLKKKLSAFPGAAECYKQWFIWDCSPACAEQHHRRGDNCNPFRFIPEHMCLIKAKILIKHSQAAWCRVAYGGCLFTQCARCVCFSVGGIWIRNNLPGNSWGWGTVWKPPQAPACKRGGKAQGPWTETCCSNASSNGEVKAALRRPWSQTGIWDPSRLKPHCNSLPLLCTSTMWTTWWMDGKKQSGWETTQVLFFVRAFTLFAVFPLHC